MLDLWEILMTRNEQRRRDCCLFSIDVHFPKLDVAGSILSSQSLRIIGLQASDPACGKEIFLHHYAFFNSINRPSKIRAAGIGAASIFWPSGSSVPTNAFNRR